MTPPTLGIDESARELHTGAGASPPCAECRWPWRPANALAVVGESGSGKTQLFMAAMGLLPGNAAVDGRVRFEGEEFWAPTPSALNRIRGSKLTMVFQDPMTSLTPHLKIGIQLAEVLVHHAGMSWSEAGAAARRMLERVRVPEAAASPESISA